MGAKRASDPRHASAKLDATLDERGRLHQGSADVARTAGSWSPRARIPFHYVMQGRGFPMFDCSENHHGQGQNEHRRQRDIDTNSRQTASALAVFKRGGGVSLGEDGIPDGVTEFVDRVAF